MLANQHLEVWNFVCRFGEQVLLDRYTELVEPAFLGNHARKWGDTNFLLNRVQYLNAGTEAKPSPALAGRFVKDTVLHQEQKLVGGTLVPADGELPSAPSSLFVLILASHRLLFVREHRGSPDAKQFAATIDKFIRIERNKLVDKLHSDSRATEERRSKADLLREIPPPEVTATPILLHSDIEAFVKRFARIRKIAIEIAPTNDEPDNEEFFKALRENGNAINAKKSRVEYVATPNESLDPKAAILQVKAAQNGQATFSIAGEDRAGNVLTGDNDELRMRVPLHSAHTEVPNKASDAVAVFRGLADVGALNPGAGESRFHATLLALASRLFG
jgi:hypothetical protein